MRAILIAITLLAAAPVSADETCRRVSEVIDYVKRAQPTSKHHIYTDNNGRAVAVSFSRPGVDNLMVIRVKGGCANGHVQLTREQVEALLAKKGAAQ